MTKDLVCGMEVEKGKICSTYQGQTYCFCSEGCKTKFEATPQEFVKKEGKKDSCCCH